MRLTKIWSILFFLISSNILWSQTTQIEFGQNRVQYHDFEFMHYETENLHVYFYMGGQELGKFVVLAGEELIQYMEEKLDYRINSQIEILIYNDISDLAQTNVGLGRDFYNVGGTTRIIDNKLFVYFDGDHNHLVESLKKGFAELYIRAMMTGGNLQEILQNTFLMSLPAWFKPGLANYIGSRWNTTLDDELRNYFLYVKNPSLKKLLAQQPDFGGQAVWHYIEARFGEASIQDILYMTRINRSANNGFNYVVGESLDNILIACEQYYYDTYVQDTFNRQQLDIEKIKTAAKKDIEHVLISPDGKYLAYSIHQGGFFKVFTKDIATGKKKKVVRAGFKSDNYPFDYSYPLLAWTPGATRLSVVYERRDEIQHHIFNNKGKKVSSKPIRKLDRVYQIAYTPDGNKLILSGQHRGQSDIFLYDLVLDALTPVTNDMFDDLYPAYYTQGDSISGILFVSNRNTTDLANPSLDSVLPLGNFDLYFYNINQENYKLSELSQTSFAQEKGVSSLSNGTFSYLSDESGIYNIYAGTLTPYISGYDTLITLQEVSGDTIIEITPIISYNAEVSPQSDFAYAAKEFSLERNGTAIALLAAPKKPIATSVDLQLRKPRSTVYRDNSSKSSESDISKEEITQLSAYQTEIDALVVDTFAFYFESDFNNTIYTQKEKDSISAIGVINGSSNVAEQGDEVSLQRKYAPFFASRIVSYTPRFTSDYVVTQVDNSLLPFAYQNYNINGGAFNQPTLNGMITFGVKDVLENHRLVGGFRIPTNFDGTDVYVSYNNVKKRLDQRYLFYRSSDKIVGTIEYPAGKYNTAVGRPKTHYLEARLSYPLDVTKSIRLTVGYRNDRLLVAYTDTFTLGFRDDINENWSLIRLEYVKDNAKEIQFNIPEGFKCKAYTEFFKDWSRKKTDVFTVGFDMRYYLKIHKNIIWANRLAGASSFGHEKILYFLGGVDSWLNQSYNYNNPTDVSYNYAFQTVVTNMRGYPQNARNGNSFTVLNSELRVPLFSYLLQRPLKSSFFKNFQLIGFFDMGAAYKGLTLFDNDNPYRSELVTTPLSNSNIGNPIEVTVNYYRNPMVYSYGVGLRTTLLGYFVRLDLAWARDAQYRNDNPKFLFSLSKDF